jgi:hypothetical protein
MSNTIISGDGEYAENRLIKSPDGTDSTYRLDIGGVSMLFDQVEVTNSRNTFTLYSGGEIIASVDADVLDDAVEGSLAVLSLDS